jgi:tetratricopeptide (TPR) repeat protein
MSETFEAKIMSLDLAFGPENEFFFNEFGIRMRKTGQLDMARAYYEKALAVSEADANLLFNLGRVYFELGEFALAVEAAGKALAINPGFAIAGKLKRAAEKAGAASDPGRSAASPTDSKPGSEQSA